MTLRTGIALLALFGGTVVGCRTKIVPTGVACGPGTDVVDGLCVPATSISCGDGTTLVNGRCQAPQCGLGTMLKNGQCVIADAVCGPGTVLVGNQCRATDPLSQVTVPETPEPNDSASSAAKFTLPEVGAAPIVLGGTVDAVQGNVSDFDWFVFSASAQQRIRIEATAVGAPSIGVILAPTATPDSGVSPLQRFVVSFDSRTASREIVLPVGGEWALQVSDADNLGLSTAPASGGADFSYYVKVSQVTSPAMLPLPLGPSVSGALTSGDVFRLVPDVSVLPIVDVRLTPPDGVAPFRGVRTLWAVDASGKLVFSANDVVSSDGSVQPMSTQRILVPAAGLTVGVDYVYGLETPGAYQLVARPLAAKPISSQPYSDNDTLPNDAERARVYSLQIPADGVIDATLTPADPTSLQPRIELRDSSFVLVSSAADASSASSSSAELHAYVPAGKEGLYFLLVVDAHLDPSDTNLAYTFQVSGSQAVALPALSPPGNATLSAPIAQGSGGTVFAVPFSGPGVARFTLTPSATAVIGATLTTDSGQTLFTISPGSSRGQSVVFDNVPIPKAERLLVTAVASQGSGTVTLAAAAAAASFVTEVYPNHTRMQAQPVPIDPLKPTVITGAFKNGLDGDWYGFTLPSGGSVSVTLEPGPTGGQVSANLIIDNQLGNSLQQSTAYSGFTQVSAMNVSAGQFYVELEPFFSSPGDYTLVLRQVP